MPGQGPFEFAVWPPEFRTVFGELPGSRMLLPLWSRLRLLRKGQTYSTSGHFPEYCPKFPTAKPEIQTDLGRA